MRLLEDVQVNVYHACQYFLFRTILSQVFGHKWLLLYYFCIIVDSFWPGQKSAAAKWQRKKKCNTFYYNKLNWTKKNNNHSRTTGFTSNKKQIIKIKTVTQIQQCIVSEVWECYSKRPGIKFIFCPSWIPVPHFMPTSSSCLDISITRLWH